MKTKFLKVLDKYTEMHFLVLQFEEVDRPFCKGAGFDPGLKVALQFRGRIVTCFAGYDLREYFGGTVDDLSHKMQSDGTVRSLKEILHFVKDIRALPDTVDVDSYRCQSNLLRRDRFPSDELLEEINDRSPAVVRKVLYRWGQMTHLAIIDIETSEVIYDVGSTGDLTVRYLWLPMPEADEEDLAGIELCPFKYVRL
jgi:hypothetical protein